MSKSIRPYNNLFSLLLLFSLLPLILLNRKPQNGILTEFLLIYSLTHLLIYSQLLIFTLFIRYLMIPNIHQNFLKFFLGWWSILRGVSKILLFTTQRGALFSKPLRKSIVPPWFSTNVRFCSNNERCSSVQISWNGVQVKLQKT